MHPFFVRTWFVLNQPFCPADGIPITEHKLERDEHGVLRLRKRTFRHHVILSEVAADTPANSAH